MFTDITLTYLVIAFSLLMFIPKRKLFTRLLFWKVLLAAIINTTLLAAIVFLVPGGKEGGIIAVGLFALNKAFIRNPRLGVAVDIVLLFGTLAYFIWYSINVWSVGLLVGFLYLTYCSFKGYRSVDKDTPAMEEHRKDKENLWFCVSPNASQVAVEELRLAIMSEVMHKKTKGFSLRVDVGGVRVLVRSFVQIERIRSVMLKILEHNAQVNEGYEYVVSLIDASPARLMLGKKASVADAFFTLYQGLDLAGWDMETHLRAMSNTHSVPFNLTKAYIRTPEIKLFSN